MVFPGGRRKTFHALTEVTFQRLDAVVIEQYLALVNPLDKAGGYGIQEYGELLVERICGSFDNVMGLPVAPVIEALGRKSDCGSEGVG